MAEEGYSSAERRLLLQLARDAIVAGLTGRFSEATESP